MPIDLDLDSTEIVIKRIVSILEGRGRQGNVAPLGNEVKWLGFVPVVHIRHVEHAIRAAEQDYFVLVVLVFIR